MLIALTKPEFRPDEEWFTAFSRDYLEALRQKGVASASATAYLGALMPALHALLERGDITDELFPSQWAVALTPASRALYSAAWSHLGVWLQAAVGLRVAPIGSTDPPGHPIPVRRAVVGLMGADRPPLARHVSLARWSDVHWPNGDLRLPGRSHQHQYGVPRDPAGLWVIMSWVLSPLDPQPVSFRFGLEGTALFEQTRLIRQLLGANYDLPLIPVVPGSCVPISRGVIHAWAKRYSG